MQPLDSRAVSESLESYARDRLAESDFFSDLSAGQVHPSTSATSSASIYLWRNRFHRVVRHLRRQERAVRRRAERAARPR